MKIAEQCRFWQISISTVLCRSSWGRENTGRSYLIVDITSGQGVSMIANTIHSCDSSLISLDIFSPFSWPKPNIQNVYQLLKTKFKMNHDHWWEGWDKKRLLMNIYYCFSRDLFAELRAWLEGTNWRFQDLSEFLTSSLSAEYPNHIVALVFPTTDGLLIGQQLLWNAFGLFL